jgi:carboxyl-terminal processing protease
MKIEFKQNKLLILLIALLLLITLWPKIQLNADSWYMEYDLLKKVTEEIKTKFYKKKLNDKKLEYGAIKGMLDALDDPYTSFIEPDSYQEMKMKLNGHFDGIGIHIGMYKKRLTVIAPIPGTPAEKAGLMALDTIMKIDRQDTEKMSLMDAVHKIRGKKGSKVVLGVKRNNSPDILDIAITRNTIDINAVEKTEVFKEKIGYVRLVSFENKNAVWEMRKALKSLMKKNIETLILDLRFNGGGLVSNAIGIARLFLTDNDIMHTIDRNGLVYTEHVYGDAYYTGPLIVLINEASASSSEILAGALKDNKRATIMGKKSFGKATVQNIIEMGDGSAVKYTIAKYQTPAGVDISETGITVNIEINIPTENIKQMYKDDYLYTYETDYQLQKAIELAEQKLVSTTH